MTDAFSLRKPLQGELLDFVKSSGFDCSHTTELVRDITCLLASYREEDVPLFPDVYVLPTVKSVFSLAPGTQRVVVGSAKLNVDAEKVLKDCAALAVNGWAIYVAKIKANTGEYGVFRSLIHSFATSAEEVMTEPSSSSPAILIRNRGHLVVELRNAKNASFTASFTSAPATESTFARHVATFASAAVEALATDQRKATELYFVRLLIDSLQRCHGTLLAAHVCPPNSRPPEQFQDGVWLREPLDLASALSTARSTKDAQALATLQAAEALLCGMIASDGVVVFGTNGTVLGYRVFLKPSDKEKKGLPEKGGGRRRTYALMQRRLGKEMRAALFRSQDGDTACSKGSS